MTQTAAAEVRGAPVPGETAPRPRQLGRIGDFLLRSVLPLVLALATGAIILVAIGVDPIRYYKDVYSGGIELTAWQDSVMRMAPLLLIAVGLIVVFRAGIWNLGMDGQFLLAAVITAALAPALVGVVPKLNIVSRAASIASGSFLALSILTAQVSASSSICFSAGRM